MAEETPTIGHNQLRSITERINRLEDDRKSIGEDIKEVYLEAKSSGFDVKALRSVIKRQRADAAKLAAHEAIVETYLLALGLS
jgi:uncharacterized protein (UPF0335 family)